MIYTHTHISLSPGSLKGSVTKETGRSLQGQEFYHLRSTQRNPISSISASGSLYLVW